MVMCIWAMAPETIVYLWAASTVKAVTPSARLPSAVSLRSVRCSHLRAGQRSITELAPIMGPESSKEQPSSKEPE